MERSITEITKSASRELGAIYMKYQSAGGMTYYVYSKLIDSVVEPVLSFCAGILANRKLSKVESIINKACRYFLGVSKNAQHASSKGVCRSDTKIRNSPPLVQHVPVESLSLLHHSIYL